MLRMGIALNQQQIRLGADIQERYILGMTIQEIEKAVKHLPADELHTFRSWFENYDSKAWDKQFEADARSGKLDELADRAVKDLKANKCTRL